MEKSLRLISINFPFLETPVEHVRSLATRKPLSDYDVIVIRPHPVCWLLDHPVSKQGGDCWVEGSDFAKAESIIIRQKAVILRLLERGGLVVVILDSREILRWNPYNSGQSHVTSVQKLSNYDFLDEQFRFCVGHGCGKDVRLVDTSVPFSQVLQNSLVRWTAYLERKPVYPYGNPRIFARNTAGDVLGAIFECAGGHIVALPNFEKLDEKEFLFACKAHRSQSQEVNPPNWIPAVYLPGEYSASSRVMGVEIEIKRLQQKRASEIAQREELLRYKGLLYQYCRVHLEAAVRKALELLGFVTCPSEDLHGYPIEISGKVRGVCISGALQAKASQREISCAEFLWFTPKLTADGQHTEFRGKSVFVGNGFNESPPGTRLGTVIFSAKVLAEAEKQSVSLLNSAELYWVVCGVLSKEIEDLERIREAILTASGYVDLRPFCGIPPFQISP
jgi:hypothetical protein